MSLTYDTGVLPETDSAWAGAWASVDDIAAWERDDWVYVVVKVVPIDDRGRAWERDASVLSAVVWGTLGDGTSIGRTELEEHPLPGMIEEAMDSVRTTGPLVVDP
ncbi:hypothetical protein [Streptomyces cucumeris]|uniref:hypothetical protein n=1 Tax=Streptomyces cucumeris TaxID=2962890 RepID=UPI0020C84FCA|nr:hypothetical protein [Streptomyces sp. NEAU-Y11]MCP9209548.1 hypothetical protein [Streptomyces sp. NEAU-Y11]